MTAMKGNMELRREKIVRALNDALAPLDYAKAFYEGGAVAFNRIDEWSDLDFYVVVDDDKVNDTFAIIEKALESISRISQKCERQNPEWPDMSQAFYRLEGTSEYLLIDLVVIKLSSPEKFLQPEIHGNVLFHFNKSNMVKALPFDKAHLVTKIQRGLERLRARYSMFNKFVQKEINRGNKLEAIDLYHNLTLAMLVDVLRLKNNPFHWDFRMHYIHYELPQEVVKRLEHLYFVRDDVDLKSKYDEATQWLCELLSEIREEDVRKIMGATETKSIP